MCGVIRFNLDKMHLQPIKVCRTDKLGDMGGQMSEDEDLDDYQAEHACLMDDMDLHGGVKPASDTVQEDELSKAMSSLKTTHFVPRAVQMRGKK
jgi:hypothetical protein